MARAEAGRIRAGISRMLGDLAGEAFGSGRKNIFDLGNQLMESHQIRRRQIPGPPFSRVLSSHQ